MRTYRDLPLNPKRTSHNIFVGRTHADYTQSPAYVFPVECEGDTVPDVLCMEIAKGCEGIEGILIIIAAVCAFPAGVREKAFGLLAGVLLIYALNLTRIVGLWFTLRHKPALFEIMHIYVGQTYIIFFGFIFFVWWAVRGERAP